MPNFNFNAPVIRLGTQGGRAGAADSPAGGRRDNASAPARRGLGMDKDGDRRNEIQQVFPPTREEIARTIFVGNIPDGVGGDAGMERVLETAGKLVRWTRATDANNKPQTFGFAEFGDAEALEVAAAIFTEVRVPKRRQKPGQVKKEGGEEEEVETTQLQVIVDDASIVYAEQWSKTRKDDEATAQFRLDTAKEALSQVLASFFHPPNAPVLDYAGDTTMQDAQDSEDVEVTYVNLATGEDELADIPADMRETVAAEIAAFRDRSTQRDRERLRREEELEAEERKRSGRRVASPPPSSAPTGPGGVNGVPLGPRAERGIQGAPSGPKGSQFPRDYQNGVSFVNGGAVNNGVYINREDENDPASDEELELQRKQKRDEELDHAYQKQLSRWLNIERRTDASLGRTNDHSKHMDAELEATRAKQAKQFAEFDDDQEAATKRHIYYRDHSEYIHNREKFRGKEVHEDETDRQQERAELGAQKKQKDHARGEADAFLEELGEQGAEFMRKEEEPREPSHFKISLGAAAKKLEKTAVPRRTAADVENLLEDEEIIDQSSSKRKPLIPINFDASVRANLTQEEIEEATRQLAREIPNDREGLWKWPVSWVHLPESKIDKDIKQWAANKVLEIMGLQEDLLVDAIVEHLRSRRGPQSLVENLEVVGYLYI
jgi:RNA-binding protein 25